MQSQVRSAVFTFVHIMVANFFNCLPYFLLCNVFSFLSEALFYFFPILLFVCTHVHILMSSVSIYIHVSIFPPVSIFLPVLISIFLPVSISIFCLSQFRFFCLSRLRSFFLSRIFCLFRIFCHVNQIVRSDTSCSIFDKSPRSSLEECDRFVVPWYLRGGTWYKRE